MQLDPIDFKQNFFQLFDLHEQFRIDVTVLGQRYRALQTKVHPDKFAHLHDAERRISMQWASRVNEAYQTLSRPVARARYLLGLLGVDTQEETNTVMPSDFLMQQMEWREGIEEAVSQADESALAMLGQRLGEEMRALETDLAVKMDDLQEYAAAAGDVRKLRFLEKLAEEIASAYDMIDNR